MTVMESECRVPPRTVAFCQFVHRYKRISVLKQLVWRSAYARILGRPVFGLTERHGTKPAGQPSSQYILNLISGRDLALRFEHKSLYQLGVARPQQDDGMEPLFSGPGQQQYMTQSQPFADRLFRSTLP